ncbi:MAG: nitroreductase family protein [Candidatus Thorarchaeota archaeon]
MSQIGEKSVLETCKELFAGNDEMMQTLQVRRSIRTYDDVPLRQGDIELIKKYLSSEELLTGPFGRKFRIEFLDKGPMKNNASIGTYGYLKNPPAFLVAMAENDKYTLFECAYVFHGLVLFLTYKGLATCWLGGIFNQDDVRATTYVAPDEIVPAISPVGYSGKSFHLFGKLAGVVLKPKNRKPVEQIAFFGTFDKPFTDQQSIFYDTIHIGTLAPNSQNKQSWRIVVSEDQTRMHMYVKHTLKKQVHDGFRGYACPPEYLDIAIFYRQFEIAMNNKGRKGTLEIADPELKLPESDWEYIITWKMK